MALADATAALGDLFPPQVAAEGQAGSDKAPF